MILFTAVRWVFETAYRIVYPFLAIFARGLGVSLEAVSLAVTARAVMAAFGPFLASIADSRGRKVGMVLGAAIFVGGMALVVFLPAYPAFFLSLLLVALALSVYNPTIQAFLGDRVPYARRGLAMATTELSWSLGFIVGVPLAGILIVRFGWGAPFTALLVLGLAALGIILWLIPNHRPAAGGLRSLSASFREVLSYGPALAGLFMSMAFASANESVNLVFGVWMEDNLGVKIAALGAASAVIGFAELSGEAASAILNDRIGKERSIATGLVVNCLAAGLLPFVQHSLVGAFMGLFCFYLSFEFSIVCSLPLLSEVLPAARATLLAMAAAAGFLGRAGGSLLAPWLYHWGILGNVLACILFNSLALVALRKVRIKTAPMGGKSPVPGSLPPNPLT